MSGTVRRTGRHRHRGGAQPPGAQPPGHGHGHGPAFPVSHRVHTLLVALLVPVVLATLAGLWITWPGETPERDETDFGFGQRPVHGEVVTAQSAPCTTGDEIGAAEAVQSEGCVALGVLLTDGGAQGEIIRQIVPDEPSTPRFSVGDEVVLAYSGGDPGDELSYQVVDFQRGAPMLWLVALFAVAVLLLGRWKGVASLTALGFTFGVLVVYLFPAILGGADPVIVGVLAAGVIMFGTLYVSHGFSARTSTAVLGTLLSLALIGVLGTVFTAATQLTGLDDGTRNLVSVLGTDIDARGLLLAGVIIGALGVLDDVTVTQASSVWELRRANPGLSAAQLYSSALRIGRDHITAAVNTLALAYAGAALPVLLAYSLSGQTFGTLVTAQDVAQEVVRTLVGSIGLVASVPITTAIAAFVARRDEVGDDSPGGFAATPAR